MHGKLLKKGPRPVLFLFQLSQPQHPGMLLNTSA
jgi:hypothetical protein